MIRICHLFFKVFLAKLENNLYALKSINKQDYKRDYTRDRDRYKVDYISYFKGLVSEKEVGLLGHECRFIVKLMGSFQSEVVLEYIIYLFNLFMAEF